MVTIAAALILSIPRIPYSPNLRTYEHGDSWSFSRTYLIPLEDHPLVFASLFKRRLEEDGETEAYRKFRSVQTAFNSEGKEPLKDGTVSNLIRQSKVARDVRIDQAATTDAQGKEQITRYEPSQPGLSGTDNGIVSPSPLTLFAIKGTYLGREWVPLTFADVECKRYRFELQDRTVECWYNPKLGVPVMSREVWNESHGSRTISIDMLVETNVL